MTKALYIGAGLDLTPVIGFPSITEWIYVDCEHAKWFVEKVIIRMLALGYSVQTKRKNYYFFHCEKSQSNLHYYFKVNVNETIGQNTELVKQIQECSVLVDMGHHPHYKILDFLPRIDQLILDNKTIYKSPITDTDDEEVFHHSRIPKLRAKLSKHHKIYQIILDEFMCEEYWTRVLLPDTPIQVKTLQCLSEVTGFNPACF
jgi:hypothetical protein